MVWWSGAMASGWSRPVIKVADFGLSKYDTTFTFTRVVRHTHTGCTCTRQHLSTLCDHMQ